MTLGCNLHILPCFPASAILSYFKGSRSQYLSRYSWSWYSRDVYDVPSRVFSKTAAPFSQIPVDTLCKKIKSPEQLNGFLPADKEFKILWLLNPNTPRARHCSGALFQFPCVDTDKQMSKCVFGLNLSLKMLKKQVQMHWCILQHRICNNEVGFGCVFCFPVIWVFASNQVSTHCWDFQVQQVLTCISVRVSVLVLSKKHLPAV